MEARGKSIEETYKVKREVSETLTEDVNLHLTCMLTNMTMSEGLRKILDIIADGTGRNLSKSIPDTDVIERSGLTSEEAYKYTRRIRLYLHGRPPDTFNL